MYKMLTLPLLVAIALSAPLFAFEAKAPPRKKPIALPAAKNAPVIVLDYQGGFTPHAPIRGRQSGKQHSLLITAVLFLFRSGFSSGPFGFG